jgi:hypothetical protein
MPAQELAGTDSKAKQDAEALGRKAVGALGLDENALELVALFVEELVSRSRGRRRKL